MAAYELKYTAEEIDGILESVDKKTIYGDATQSEHGLMSATDKSKLDSLPTSQQIGASLSGKVDKENGKGLSTNDYDATAKGKVDAIPQNPKYTDTVYDDTALSGRVSTIEGKESGWDAKQDALVSGTNIKTVNGESLLGSGNIEIQGGEENVIEAITMNGASVPITNKTAAITETDPTVPSWAKQPNKPSYNYSEIGNTPTIPTVPTNVSAFNNDAGYLTQHQDLSNYVQKSNTAGLIKNDGTVDTTQYGTYSKPSGGIPASDLESGVIPTVPVQDVTVGGTSVVNNGTAVIPQEVFWATYGSTTAAEVDAAVAAGKDVVFYNNNNRRFRLELYDSSGDILFSNQTKLGLYTVTLKRSNNTWSTTGYTAANSADKVSTISGYETNETKYPNTKAVADALGKWGVISQTQTWSGTGSNPRTYVMSDLVRGLIPQANIDLFESAGATFNATSGYFELNGLTDISYEEMKEIYMVSSVCFQSILNRNYTFAESTVRTNFPLKVCSYVGYTPTMPNMFYASNTEIVAFSLTNAITPQAGQLGSCFNGASKVKNIIGVLNLKNQTAIDWSVFYNTYSLESINISSIKASIELKQSSMLSLASVVYMVENAINTSAITITLHADALARCTADTTEYTYNSNTYTGIVALANAKNITLASA